MKQFLWRACRNAIATKEALFKRRCGSSSVCPLCGLCDETVEHAILLCEWAKNVWFCCPLALRIDPVMISSFHSWCEEWMGKVFKGDELAGCMFAYGCWLIWKGRYEAVFEGGSIDPVVVGRRIFSAAVEFCNANGRISEINDVVAEEDCRWMPPENGQLKANIDGSFDKASMKAGVGVLIRDSEGCVVDG